MRVASRAARRLQRVHAHPVLSTHRKTESIYITIIETYMKGPYSLYDIVNIMYEQTIEFGKTYRFCICCTYIFWKEKYFIIRKKFSIFKDLKN